MNNAPSTLTSCSSLEAIVRIIVFPTASNFKSVPSILVIFVSSSQQTGSSSQLQLQVMWDEAHESVNQAFSLDPLGEQKAK